MKNNILKLISPIAPTTNHYLNYRVMRKSGKNIVMPYPSKETVTFKKSFIPYVKEEVGKQNGSNWFATLLCVLDCILSTY